jgi:hypothetical protein
VKQVHGADARVVGATSEAERGDHRGHRGDESSKKSERLNHSFQRLRRRPGVKTVLSSGFE